MVNAQYGQFKVNVHHNGQHRSAILHVVALPNNQHHFFLRDFYGWAIDDARTVEIAVQQYATGVADEIVE